MMQIFELSMRVTTQYVNLRSKLIYSALNARDLVVKSIKFCSSEPQIRNIMDRGCLTEVSSMQFSNLEFSAKISSQIRYFVDKVYREFPGPYARRACQKKKRRFERERGSNAQLLSHGIHILSLNLQHADVISFNEFPLDLRPCPSAGWKRQKKIHLSKSRHHLYGELHCP